MIIRRLFALLGYKTDNKGLSDFNKKLDDTKSKMKSVGSQAGSFFAKISSGFSQLRNYAIGGLFVGATVGLKKFANGLIDANIRYQKLLASLELTEGSATQAKESFKDIFNLALETPFGLEEVTASFVRLKNRGITPTKDEFISMGGIAIANNKQLSDWIEALLDAQTGQFRRLLEFGILGERTAKKYIFTFRGIKYEVEKNEKAVYDFFNKIGKENFASGVELQAKTIGGKLEKLKDKIFLFFTQIGDAGFNEAFSNFLDFLYEGSIFGESFAKVISDYLVKGLAFLQKAIIWVVENWKKLLKYVATSYIVGEILNILYIVGNFIKNVGGFGRILLIALAAIKDFIAPLAFIAGWLLVIQDLVYFFIGNKSAIGQFFDNFLKDESVFGNIARGLLSITSGLKFIFDKAKGGIGRLFSGDSYSKTWSKLVSNIKAGVFYLLKFFGLGKNEIGKSLEQIGNDYGKWFIKIGNAVSRAFDYAIYSINWVIDLTSTVVKYFFNWFRILNENGVWNSLGKSIGSIWNSIRNMVGAVTDGIWFIITLIGKMFGTTFEVKDLFRGMAEDSIWWMQGFAKFVEYIAAAFRFAEKAIVQFWSNVIGYIRTALLYARAFMLAAREIAKFTGNTEYEQKFNFYAQRLDDARKVSEVPLSTQLNSLNAGREAIMAYQNNANNVSVNVTINQAGNNNPVEISNAIKNGVNQGIQDAMKNAKLNTLGSPA